MDLRVKALGWALRHLPPASGLASLTPEQITKLQQQTLGHNPVVDFLFGGLDPGAATVDGSFEGPGGEPVKVRVYTPREAAGGGDAPLIVNYHGGGFVLGNLDQADWLCSTVSARVGAVVVSVDYRLAPAHPFPAAVDDCYAALEWAAGRAGSWSADAGRIGVMGDSAGGNLAAVVALVARERSGPEIAHQALIYPAADLTDGSSAFVRRWDSPILSTDEARAYRRFYLGDDLGSAADPYASPILAADLSGLPPALVQVAEHDPLGGDGKRYAEALREAGVPVRLTEYVGMPHGYLSFPKFCRSASQAVAEICSEQASALGGRGSGVGKRG